MGANHKYLKPAASIQVNLEWKLEQLSTQRMREHTLL